MSPIFARSIYPSPSWSSAPPDTSCPCGHHLLAQVVECSEGEDEFDCDWHKRSTVETVTTRQQFETWAWLIWGWCWKIYCKEAEYWPTFIISALQSLFQSDPWERERAGGVLRALVPGLCHLPPTPGDLEELKHGPATYCCQGLWWWRFCEEFWQKESNVLDAHRFWTIG